jgi:hypothetical protein
MSASRRLLVGGAGAVSSHTAPVAEQASEIASKARPATELHNIAQLIRGMHTLSPQVAIGYNDFVGLASSRRLRR